MTFLTVKLNIAEKCVVLLMLVIVLMIKCGLYGLFDKVDACFGCVLVSLDYVISV